MEECVRNKNKERLLVEAKALRRDMKVGVSAALLIRDDRYATRSILYENLNREI